MLKNVKRILLMSSLFLLLGTKVVFADTNTTLFSRINEDDLEEPTKLIVCNVVNSELENISTFAVNDVLTSNQFESGDIGVEEISDEILVEEITPLLLNSRIIIKDEIKRIEKEEQKRLEEERRKEEEKKRVQRYQQQLNVTTYSGMLGTFQSHLLAQLGKPYVYGGNGPGSFDCSGLAKYVYGKIGVNLPRVASDQQRVGVAVNRTLEDLKYGDLVFFKDPGQTGASHVGIYVGNGQMIHAPRTGDVVKYTNIFTGYYQNRFFSAKRFVNFEETTN